MCIWNNATLFCHGCCGCCDVCNECWPLGHCWRQLEDCTSCGWNHQPSVEFWKRCDELACDPVGILAWRCGEDPRNCRKPGFNLNLMQNLSSSSLQLDILVFTEVMNIVFEACALPVYSRSSLELSYLSTVSSST